MSEFLQGWARNASNTESDEEGATLEPRAGSRAWESDAKQEFYCETCDRLLNGPEALADHLRGKEHHRCLTGGRSGAQVCSVDADLEEAQELCPQGIPEHDRRRAKCHPTGERGIRSRLVMGVRGTQEAPTVRAGDRATGGRAAA